MYYSFLPDDLSLLQISLMYIMQNWWLELQGLSAVFDLGISTHNNVSMEELYVWNCTHEVFF
jgi:hypothetical protein